MPSSAKVGSASPYRSFPVDFRTVRPQDVLGRIGGRQHLDYFGGPMSQEVFKFQADESLKKIIHAFETPRGLEVALKFEEEFGSSSAVIAAAHHTTRGTVVDFPDGSTLLLTHIPLHEFDHVVSAIGATFGF
jgi:hypothetical protein